MHFVFFIKIASNTVSTIGSFSRSVGLKVPRQESRSEINSWKIKDNQHKPATQIVYMLAAYRKLQHSPPTSSERRARGTKPTSNEQQAASSRTNTQQASLPAIGATRLSPIADRLSPIADRRSPIASRLSLSHLAYCL